MKISDSDISSRFWRGKVGWFRVRFGLSVIFGFEGRSVWVWVRSVVWVGVRSVLLGKG